MSRKITLSILIAVIASLLVFSLAFAQGRLAGAPPRGGRRGVGKVLSLSANRFSLGLRRDRQQTFYVDETTFFRDAQGNVLGFEDLQVGQWAAVTAWPSPEGLLVARMVIALPDDYNPAQRLGRRAAGDITAVDEGAGTFELHTRRGENLAFAVNENTIFRGRVASFADLEPGMLASVGAMAQEDGSLLALVVLARYPLTRHAGRIAEVDVADATFELETRTGETLLIAVDERTRYRSREGAIGSLEDVQPGMLALVMVKTDSTDQLTAVLIAAGTEDQLPQFDLRSLGKVVSLSEAGFILQGPNGEQYTITVTDETRFLSWRSRVQGLDDIDPGMRLLIGAALLEDGSYQARLIIAGGHLRP